MLSNKHKESKNRLSTEMNINVNAEFKKIIMLSKKLSEQNGAKFYFVYLPDYFRFKSGYQYEPSFSQIKNILIELDISLIDINKEVFDKLEDPLELFPFKQNGHYNVRGYKIVAEAIFRSLKP